jgi:hypothetical protein
MKKVLLLLIISTLFLFSCVTIPESHFQPLTYNNIDYSPPTIINKESEMRSEGWRYVMPQPKSPQAAWGNTDGRTTWWVGYWINNKTGENSSDAPILINGKYKGDNKACAGCWRRGGSPMRPSTLEEALSE